MTQSILVVGAGAVGGFFGARLVAAGRDVVFLVRQRRAESLRAQGLQVLARSGALRVEPRVATAETLDRPYDVILLSVKGHGLESAMADFAPAVGAETTILPTLNGMQHIERLKNRFGERPVIGGVCMVATSLDDQGRIVQLADFQKLAYGELNGRRSERILALDATLSGAGFDAEMSSAIVQDMWNKWVQLASLGAITTLLDGSIGEIAAAGGRETALALVEECRAAAAAFGHAPDEAVMTHMRAMVAEEGSRLTSSLYRDMRAGLPLEHEEILGDLLDRAKAKNVKAPLLAAALTKLRVREHARVR